MRSGCRKASPVQLKAYIRGGICARRGRERIHCDIPAASFYAHAAVAFGKSIAGTVFTAETEAPAGSACLGRGGHEFRSRLRRFAVAVVVAIAIIITAAVVAAAIIAAAAVTAIITAAAVTAIIAAAAIAIVIRAAAVISICAYAAAAAVIHPAAGPGIEKP